MVIKKKTILLISLVFLLIIVGYANHQFTQHSLRQSSSEYRKYENSEMAKIINDENTIETLAEAESEEYATADIIDSKATEIVTLATDANVNTKKNSNYFVEYRLARDKLRGELIDRLNDIVENKNTDSKIRTEAQYQLLKIGEISEKELRIEELIKAKEFEDVVVFLDDSSIRIVISINELTEQDVVKIVDIVKGETDFDTSDIKILKKS